MPLKLIPPRTGLSRNWRVRGTYLHVHVDQSTGVASRAKAARVLAAVRDDIERGRFARRGDPTFLTAAVAYMETGGERRFVGPLLDHFGETPLSQIDQAAIDAAAVALYPDATNATRNRQVYSVVSAIMKRGGVDAKIKRPKGAQGESRTEWLRPEQAFRLLRACCDVDAELGVLVTFLLYTGARLSEALGLACDRVDLESETAHVLKTKNSEPRLVFLPPVVVASLGAHPRGIDRGSARLFRFTKGSRLYALFNRARDAAGLGPSITFHSLRHTWASWMRQHAGLDTRGLVGTGAWRDSKSAERYQHVIPADEARRAALLPVELVDPKTESV